MVSVSGQVTTYRSTNRETPVSHAMIQKKV
jgi:hypothetical protein